MKDKITLREFNKNFRYVRDITNYGRTEYWTVMEPDKNGLYKGDCEDYILTLKKKVIGFEDIEVCYCKILQKGHCVGLLDDKIIDCTAKKLVDKEEFTHILRMTDFKILSKSNILMKMTIGRTKKLVKSLKANK